MKTGSVSESSSFLSNLRWRHNTLKVAELRAALTTCPRQTSGQTRAPFHRPAFLQSSRSSSVYQQCLSNTEYPTKQHEQRVQLCAACDYNKQSESRGFDLKWETYDIISPPDSAAIAINTAQDFPFPNGDIWFVSSRKPAWSVSSCFEFSKHPRLGICLNFDVQLSGEESDWFKLRRQAIIIE